MKMSKSMKLHGKHDGQGATLSLRPGDFPLGSVESRAAARAKLQHGRNLSQYDHDCLQIVSLLAYTTYANSPNESDIRHTDVWKRGWELDQAFNPIVPSHLDPFQREEKRFQRCRDSYLFFYCLHHRLPTTGDILRRDDIEAVWGLKVLEQSIRAMRAAWARRLPQFPCPVKLEDGRVQLRSADSKPGQEIWQQHLGPTTAPEIWTLIECETLGRGASRVEDEATVATVVFRVTEEGNYYAEPLPLSCPTG